MFNNLDLNALSIDDIVEEYKLLHEKHQQLKDHSEQDAQRIHELKRSLDTSLAAEKYLTQELEQLSNQAQAACPIAESRLQQELEDLRRKYKNLLAEHETLQQDNDAKCEETRSLKIKLEATARDLAASVALRANSGQEETAARLSAMEQENAELMQKLAEYEDARVQNTFAVAEQEKTIEILKDQVSCLEENLSCKRDELEEKLQLLESSQEQLVDANAKIALLSSAPENNDRKGNSLFAEVDDQRQVMKHLLASQKKSYLDMKKIFNESKFEIHRLKRENIAMHTELQACSTIFCSADKTYQNKLNERIRQLMVENVKLERNLTVSQERLRELASEKSVTWLDSMLDFCKREKDELKSQLHSMHIQKATIEEQLRNVQQEMARWRFESLKSRCVLIDRENLLTEHKISFKAVQAMEFDIREAQIEAALPRIANVLTPTTAAAVGSKNSTPTTEVIKLETALRAPTEVIVLDTPVKVETNSAPIEIKQELIVKHEPETVEEATTESQEIQPSVEDITVQPQLGLIKVKSEQELLSPSINQELPMPAKPSRKGTPVKFARIKTEPQEENEITPNADKVKLELNTEVEEISQIAALDTAPLQDQASNQSVRSIMAKKRDIFADDTQKSVQFSSNDPIVHQLSPCENSGKENEQPEGKDIKPVKKSQCIIRRIIIAPKKTGLPPKMIYKE